MGPRVSLDAVEKKKNLAVLGIKPRPSSPYPITIIN
jgi:hypothetical protein